jgi:uncharacterized membrane protein
MLLQKTFHIHQSAAETRNRLANIGSYRHQLLGVQQATLTADGVGHFEFWTRPGRTVSVDLAEVPDDVPDRVLFRSVGGSADVAGTVEFFEVKENLTEIVLTVDYTLKSTLLRMIDRVVLGVDHFLNRQLERIQMHFDGVHAAPAQAKTSPVRHAHLAHATQFA